MIGSPRLFASPILFVFALALATGGCDPSASGGGGMGSDGGDAAADAGDTDGEPPAADDDDHDGGFDDAGSDDAGPDDGGSDDAGSSDGGTDTGGPDDGGPDGGGPDDGGPDDGGPDDGGSSSGDDSSESGETGCEGPCGCDPEDADDDGTPDCIDDCPDDPDKTEAGACGCGVSDVDSDTDGTADCNDGCPADPGKVAPGVCGCGTADDDSDDDGVLDCQDVCPNDGTATDELHTTALTSAGEFVNVDFGSPSWATGAGFPTPYTSLNNIPGASSVQSDHLRARAFGFALPSSAVIEGITVEVTRYYSTADDVPVRDHELRLYAGGAALSPTDHALSSAWPAYSPDSSPAAQIYGGPADTWGQSWTASQINGDNFGVALRAEIYDYPDPDIDWILSVANVTNVSVAVTYCAQ